MKSDISTLEMKFHSAVSVTVIINSETMKMKKYHHPYNLPISSLLSFWFILQMFLKSALVTQILLMCIHLKIYVTIIYSFSEFLLENFDIFKCFYSYWCSLIRFFLKHFQGRTSHIFKTKKPKKNRRQAIHRFHCPIKNNKLM